MNKEDKSRVVHGQVYYQNRWMPIEKKVELEIKDRKKIEEGFVRYQGEWITIEEKLARVSPPKPQEPQQIHINQTYDQRTINVDKRVTHEHKHVHLDKDTLAEYAKNRRRLGPSGENLSLDNEGNYQVLEGGNADRKMISEDKSHTRYLEDKSEDENSE